MRSLRSVLKQSPAIVISAAALVFAAGTGVSFATTSPPSVSATSAKHAAATTLTWHQLPVSKGWRGHLKYAVSNGVVYLSGTATRVARGDGILTRLPRGARPGSQQWIPIVTAGVADGGIHLLPDGTIMPFDPANNYTFVALSGSFGLGS